MEFGKFNIIFLATALLLLNLSLTVTSHDDVSDSSNKEHEIKKILYKFKELVTGLGYNESCSMKAERLRENLANTLIDTPKDNEALGLVMIDIVINNEPLCDASKLLVCGKETQRCICGDPAYQILNAQPPKYIIGDGNTCQRPQGTICPSIDSETPSKCQPDTSCKQADGSKCTLLAFVEYIRNHRDKSNRDLVKDGILEGNICTCQSDIGSANSNDFNEVVDAPTNSNNRQKREVSSVAESSALLGLPYLSDFTSAA